MNSGGCMHESRHDKYDCFDISVFVLQGLWQETALLHCLRKITLV